MKIFVLRVTKKKNTSGGHSRFLKLFFNYYESYFISDIVLRIKITVYFTTIDIVLTK